MLSPQIGIIMPCFCPSNIIKKALTMLSWQTRTDAFEIIMINDCSPNTDCEYQDLIQEFATKLNIKYLKTAFNNGPGAARQLGIENCNCPWVMFHDDDDILHTPYVIETYLNAINSISKEEIITQIYGPQLQFWGTDEAYMFIKTDANITGRLFNLNLIKFFNISFTDLFYEEDFLFYNEYLFCIDRLKQYLSNIIIREINIIDQQLDFIAYTRLRNNNSICTNIPSGLHSKTVQYLNAQLNFYLNVPSDNYTNDLVCKYLYGHFRYILNWIKGVRTNSLSNELKIDILDFHKKFQLLNEKYPGINYGEGLDFYLSFIQEIKNNTIIE